MTLAVMIVGGLSAWMGLGLALCEDGGSPGSDAFCNHRGLEASGLAIAAMAVSALLVPATAVVACRQRLFWIGLLAPLLLGLVVVALAAALATR